MKPKKYLIGSFCAAALLLCIPLLAQNPPLKAASPVATGTASLAKQSARPIPFHGMVSAVDQKAKTLTISGKEKSRTFKVTDKTVVRKGANAATMKDIVENEEVSGSFLKNADGTLEAKTVRLGPMEKAKPTAASPTASSKPSASPKL
jgi:hypothetical protein